MTSDANKSSSVAAGYVVTATPAGEVPVATNVPELRFSPSAVIVTDATPGAVTAT